MATTLKQEAEPRAVTKLGYRPELDGLRAVAIALVFLNHTGFRLFMGGEDGVVIFFVLSGFLITTLLMEEWERRGRIDVKRFYARRFIRLVPAVAVLAVFVVIVATLVLPASERGAAYLESFLAFFYLSNLYPALGGTFPAGTTFFLQHTWSLAIEEHFYLVWPFVIILLRVPERRPRVIAPVLFAIATTIAMARIAIEWHGNVDWNLLSPLRFDGFALGAALSVLFHSGTAGVLERWLRRTWPALVALALFGADVVLGDITHDWPGVLFAYYGGLLAVVVVAHLAWAPGAPLARLLARPGCVYVGKLSYSLYLWHFPIFAFFTAHRFPSLSEPVLLALKGLLPFPFAMASYHLVEMRFVAMRQRFRR